MAWAGLKVRRLRNRMGWSRSDLSRRLSIPCERIAQIENSEVEPSASEIQGLEGVALMAEKHADHMTNALIAEIIMKDQDLLVVEEKAIEEHKESMQEADQ